MIAVAVTGLRKSYGEHPVLAGLDLRVPAGRLMAVLGESGCGKTTLLRILAGFEAADAGRVELAGRLVDGDGVRVKPEERRVGYVPQEGALFPHLTAAQNVGFGLPRRRRRDGRVDEMLELVGLGGLGGRRPNELSGGQQQRVALARALAVAPSLVLLDEPFAALDPGLREQMRTDVRTAIGAVGATALLVTHDHEEAFSLADEVAVLRDGVIVQSGTPRALYSAPADAGLAEFLGDVNILSGPMEGGRIRTPLGSLAVAPGLNGNGGGVHSVLIRPEELRLSPCPGPAGDDGHVGVVEDVTFYGHDARVGILLEDGGLRLVARTLGGDTPEPGARVRVELPPTAHPLA